METTFLNQTFFMTYFTFIVLLTTGCLFSRLDAQIAPGSVLFEEKVFDFGEIPEANGKVSHSFIFKNTGCEPVVIDKIMSGCGCVSYEWTKEPIAPGQKGVVTITYDPLYRPGFFSKEITVYSNHHKNINRIWIKGIVMPYDHPVEEDYPYDFGRGLHFNLSVLAFGKMVPRQSKQIKLRYANDTDQSMLLYFMVKGDDQRLSFTDPGKLVPKERGEMTVSYICSEKIFGEIRIVIYPVVNGEKLLQPLQAIITGGD